MLNSCFIFGRPLWHVKKIEKNGLSQLLGRGIIYSPKQISLVLRKSDGPTSILAGKVQKYHTTITYVFYFPRTCLWINRLSTLTGGKGMIFVFVQIIWILPMGSPGKKSESITEKCVWETSKKKVDSFYMKYEKCFHIRLT